MCINICEYIHVDTVQDYTAVWIHKMSDTQLMLAEVQCLKSMFVYIHTHIRKHKTSCFTKRAIFIMCVQIYTIALFKSN